jgi:pyrroloquinoline quinone biosynthesis protein D
VSRPARAPGLSEVELDGEYVVYDGTRLHRLDPTAAAVWSLVDGRTAEDAIVKRLSRAYGAPRERVAADVGALLAALRTAGLLAG